MSDFDRFELAEDEIAVTPTKALFVDMLTRDINLSRAVLDLIDNSVDGARRLRPDPNASLEGLEIVIELDANHFLIRDNCGGIGIDTARRYAFRFGRPKDMPATPGSVGQFGVGMKRALFKFGRHFEVRSTSFVDRFVLNVNVDDWEADEANWRFKFDSAEKDLTIPVEQTGTTITVTRLRPDTASAFGLDNFKIALSREVQAAQQHYIDRGLRIVFDGRTLIATPWRLLRGEGFEPARREEQIRIEGHPPVFVRVFAGVGQSSPRQAGWYIFCNGRMVLEADQTALTGWSALAEADATIPKYHNQFARFRGFVFFDCEEASLLPWNTTKTGVDQDSAIYRAALVTMIESMRPIIDFLNRVDAERESPEPERQLTKAIDRATPVRLSEVTRNGSFSYPSRVQPAGTPTTGITYKRPRDLVAELQEALGARTAKETGEMSFDLTYKQTVGD